MQGYIALIFPPDETKQLAVTFPDVPGCATFAPDFAEAVARANEALSGHLAFLRAEGDPVPAPRTLEAIAADPEFADDVREAMPQLIVPRALSGERVRVNIMLDKGLLRQIDDLAEAEGATRSGLIETALLARIGAA